MRPWYALLLCLLLGACATPLADSAAAAPAFLADARFAPPSERVDAADVFALSPEMKRYLEVEIADKLRQKGMQKGLIDAL